LHRLAADNLERWRNQQHSNRLHLLIGAQAALGAVTFLS
jgi:hypothetical protein